MEEVLIKVEEALSEMRGFDLIHSRFEGGQRFIKCIDLFYVCDMRFCLWIEVDVYKDGRVEYNITEEHASKMKRREIRQALSERSGLADWRVEKLCDDICTAIEGMMESMHASFGMQFEKLLPDVEIVDRTYCR